MEHNLDDSLNLESAMGVDFEHGEDTVVNQADISLARTAEEGIPMEFEHIEEQPILMDTGNEEIIVSDFMGEQFTLQEYSAQDDQMATITATGTHQQDLMTSQSESMIEQFEQGTFSVPASGVVVQGTDMHMPKIITVKAALPTLRPLQPVKKDQPVAMKTPRQVAIAPKPPRPEVAKKSIYVQAKQFAIAPKPEPRPMTLVANKSISLVKKVSTASNIQTIPKGNTVLAQIGKQLVMMPAGSAQKIKLVTTAGTSVPTVRLLNAGDNEQTQLLNQNLQPKQVMTKFVMQGPAGVGGEAGPPQGQMVTKLGGGARLVALQSVAAPAHPNAQVIMASPTKQGLKFAKKHVIAINSPTPKLLPAPTSQGSTTKKVVISANPTQNVILKTTAPSAVSKSGQVSKAAGQKTQLHQINVPGKGIQYIRLVTNSNQASIKPAPVKSSSQSGTGKTFVLTDNKGNLIQMTAEKMTTGQPPPLVVSSNALQKMTSKPHQKLVRIASISKNPPITMQSRVISTGGQSLLAPLSPPVETPPPSMPDVNDLLQPQTDNTVQEPHHDVSSQQSTDDNTRDCFEIEPTDSKAALRALIADAVGEDDQSQHSDSELPPLDDSQDNVRTGLQEVEIDYVREQERAASAASGESAGSAADDGEDRRPMIVVPSTFMKQHSSSYHAEEPRQMNNSMVNVEVDPYNPYSPNTQAMSENDLVSTELDLRPRKACNCTKSQCLKLYCDCFANGEFCNRCNCHNCHNNLENEELRQKAIRGCLDRNPNAFRPKIGKSKIGGPEIIRRHNKGCNCKRSGCLKNYCECYEAKIACTSICKCVGCRNVEDTLERARRAAQPAARAPPRHHPATLKQPCSFMTSEVIEAVCQCLLAAAVDKERTPREPVAVERDPVRDVIEEFARCLQDIISASHQANPMGIDEQA